MFKTRGGGGQGPFKKCLKKTAQLARDGFPYFAAAFTLQSKNLVQWDVKIWLKCATVGDCAKWEFTMDFLPSGRWTEMGSFFMQSKHFGQMSI